MYFYIGQIEETNHFQVGYCSSTLDWWKEDYPAFLKEYTHLRSFVDGYFWGTFQQSDEDVKFGLEVRAISVPKSHPFQFNTTKTQRTQRF
jgi:hypothetical protein